MRLIFHGALKDMFGEEAFMNSPTVADALEGYSRQVDWPKDKLVHILADGQRLDTVDKLSHHYEVVEILPAFSGGGGKFGAILMGAVMIGASFLLPGIGVALSAALQTSLLVSGGLMILQGVVGLFMKAPKYNKTDDPEASKYLSVGKNTTAANTPVTLAWGRIDLAGHWLSLQSDSNNLSHGVFPAVPT